MNLFLLSRGAALQEEEAAAAAVYAEYIQDFSKKASDGGKTFVRGETVVPSGASRRLEFAGHISQVLSLHLGLAGA